MNDKEVIILDAGIEGGGITIFGELVTSIWRFRIAMHSNANLFEDEGQDDSCQTISEAAPPSQFEWYSSLADALAVVTYPWNKFYPVQIYPEFLHEILRLKKLLDDACNNTKRRLDEWMEASILIDRRGHPERPSSIDTDRKVTTVEYQNKVTPEGEIVFARPHGLLMGNRGVLHNDRQQIVKNSNSVAWVTCLLTSKNGVKRALMAPGRYTELFFLDEATALAAGHRPCAECRRADYRAFKDAWARGNGHDGALLAKEIDAVLSHNRTPDQRIITTDLDNLPDGVMFTDPEDGRIWLRHKGKAHQWWFDGYSEATPLNTFTGRLQLLTPSCTVAVIRAGYVPMVHPSASIPGVRRR